MLEDRNIQLGHGLQTVQERGGICVVTKQAKHGRFVPKQEFSFKAQMCDSAEQLRRSFSLATSVSVSAYGADLGVGYTQNKSHDTANFDAYYMMELEYIHGRLILDPDSQNSEILDPAIHDEVETLDTAEKWEEFYRTKGNQVVSSVTYGRKLIIIVSLSHKIRSDKLRRILEAKASAQEITGAAGEVSARSAISELAKEEISSVRIYSIGDKNPNFMEEIDKLVQVRAKVNSFLNSTNNTVTVDNPNPETESKPQKTTISTPIPRQAAVKVSDTVDSEESDSIGHTSNPTMEGVIIGWETCPYVDLLKKGIKNIKNIEIAYDEMLRRTNRASHYLEAIAICHGRIDMLVQNIDFYCQGHDGAFTLDAKTEKNADRLRDILNQYKIRLSQFSRDIVAEISGQSDMGRSHRAHLTVAREFINLQREFISFFKHDLDEVDLDGLDVLWPLVDKFDNMLNAKGAKALQLKSRLNALQQATQESKNCIKKTIKALNGLSKELFPIVRSWIPLMQSIEQMHQLVQFMKRRILQLQSKSIEDFIELHSDSMQLYNLLKMFDAMANKIVGFEPLFEKIHALIESQQETWNLFLQAEFHYSKSDDTASEKSKVIRDLKQILIQLDTLLSPYISLLEQTHWFLQENGFNFDAETPIETACSMMEDLLTHICKSVKHPTLMEMREKIEIIKMEFTKEDTLCFKAVTEHFLACRLNKDEQALLRQICDKNLTDLQVTETVEHWWRDCWKKIYAIAENLDNIVNNQMPHNQDSQGSVEFSAVDFKRQSFLVGALEATRNRYFQRNWFTGPYANLLVPSNARVLRFKLEGENLPACPSQFTIISKHKRLFDHHKSSHRTLYKLIKPEDPIYPLQPNIHEVASLVNARSEQENITRREQLIHSTNESSLYKYIRIRLQFLGEVGACNKITMKIYAQMGKTLQPIGLSTIPPKGKSEYGVRFGMVGMPLRKGESVLGPQTYQYAPLSPQRQQSVENYGQFFQSATSVTSRRETEHDEMRATAIVGAKSIYPISRTRLSKKNPTVRFNAGNVIDPSLINGLPSTLSMANAVEEQEQSSVIFSSNA